MTFKPAWIVTTEKRDVSRLPLDPAIDAAPWQGQANICVLATFASSQRALVSLGIDTDGGRGGKGFVCALGFAVYLTPRT